MKAAEIKRFLTAALDAQFAGVGLKRRRGAYVLPLGWGTAEILIGMPFTYGRVSPFVNLAVRHEDYERRLSAVLGDLADSLQDHSLLAPMTSLAPGRWLDLDVEDERRARPVTDTIVGIYVEVMQPFIEALEPVKALCRSWEYVEPTKVPLALHLLGKEERLDAWLDGWDIRPDPQRRQLARRYRERLPDIARL